MTSVSPLSDNVDDGAESNVETGVNTDPALLYSKNVKVIPMTEQVRELQTIIRDKETTSSDFIFYADRLIRLVVEEGLNQLPVDKCTVVTPTGASYDGLRFVRGNCGVSICRSGEAMEKALRECCRSIRIGKILIDSNHHRQEPHVLYSRLCTDVSKRRVLLMYPIMYSGNTVLQAVKCLNECGVSDASIYLLTLFATPSAMVAMTKKCPGITMLTSEIHSDIPIQFGTKYFGTD